MFLEKKEEVREKDGNDFLHALLLLLHLPQPCEAVTLKLPLHPHRIINPPLPAQHLPPFPPIGICTGPKSTITFVYELPYLPFQRNNPSTHLFLDPAFHQWGRGFRGGRTPASNILLGIQSEPTETPPTRSSLGHGRGRAEGTRELGSGRRLLIHRVLPGRRLVRLARLLPPRWHRLAACVASPLEPSQWRYLRGKGFRMTMLRQSSSRNHRSKGLKLKKALQICLLIIVSVWLLYQLKHSYDKKKAYNENEANDLHKDDQGHGDIRFGRKDLPPKMEADSSTLDERLEDEENEEMEQEMKHDENDDNPIDEADLDKDDDLPEPGEHSTDKDEGADDVGVFEDEERKERSQEDQEKSFHGDNVSSAVTHDPPSEQDELMHHGQEKILFVDDASTAVPHENQDAEHKEEEARKAREKSFRGDDVSSSVDRDAQVTKPLPEDQLTSMDRIFEGTTNLSNGIIFQAPGVNESNAAGEHGATPSNAASNQNMSAPSTILESRTPAPVNLTSSHTGSEQIDSTPLKGQPEQQVNSTAVLNNQIQLFTDLTSDAKLNSPPNGTVTSVSNDAQKSTPGYGYNVRKTVTSSTLSNHKVVDEGNRKENQDISTKIMNKAMSEDVLLE